MITDITIKNYKSIIEIPLSLSRVNVFIGENGAGKSNILEAIVLGSAASSSKLDNEFLASRGVRVTEAKHMRPAFNDNQFLNPISISFKDSKGQSGRFTLSHDNEPYSKWIAEVANNNELSLDMRGLARSLMEYQNYLASNEVQKDKVNETIGKILVKLIANLKQSSKLLDIKKESKQIKEALKKSDIFTYDENDYDNLDKNFFTILKKESNLYRELENFLIYSPEHTALRTFQSEGQIEPLGINGEGLLKLISVLFEDSDKSCINEIKSSLKLLGWFEDFKLTEETILSPKRIEVQDHYIKSNNSYLDPMSTNEGFLFLLFYFVAITSKLTPKFFAIDNIDASLNPKLCEGLIKKLVQLAKKHDKQIILTTHNPATLDGLNLDDDEQRLFVVTRGRSGETKINRVRKPITKEGSFPVRLSEMFIKGILGGLPKGF